MVTIKIIKKSWILLIVFIIIFYVSFLIYSDIDAIGEIFYRIDFWFIPLILIFRFGAIVLRSFRQKLFLKSVGINIPGKFNLMLYASGLAMSITPASSGSMIKSYILNKKFGSEYTKTIPIVFLEKYHDVLAPLSLISFLLIFINFFEARITVIVVSILMFGLFLLFRNKTLLKKIIFKLSNFKLLKKFQENFLDFYDTIYTITNKKTMILGWMLGMASFLVDGVAIYLGFIALGVDFSFIESFVTVYTANILGMVSFIPGGFGVIEASLLGFLLKAGIALSLASSIVLITRLTGTWFSIILGFSFKLFILKNIPSDNGNNV